MPEARAQLAQAATTATDEWVVTKDVMIAARDGDANPNSGEPLGRNWRSISANNTVDHSARCPSHIVLPIAPAAPR